MRLKSEFIPNFLADQVTGMMILAERVITGSMATSLLMERTSTRELLTPGEDMILDYDTIVLDGAIPEM